MENDGFYIKNSKKWLMHSKIYIGAPSFFDFFRMMIKMWEWKQTG